MKKPYTIRYLKTAEKDLLDIFDYIQKDNPSAALSQLQTSLFDLKTRSDFWTPS